MSMLANVHIFRPTRFFDQSKFKICDLFFNNNFVYLADQKKNMILCDQFFYINFVHFADQMNKISRIHLFLKTAVLTLMVKYHTVFSLIKLCCFIKLICLLGENISRQLNFLIKSKV